MKLSELIYSFKKSQLWEVCIRLNISVPESANREDLLEILSEFGIFSTYWLRKDQVRVDPLQTTLNTYLIYGKDK